MNNHLPDLLRLSAGFRPSRLLNAARVFAGFWWSRATGKTLHPGMPVSLSIEPTTSCNLRCPECPSGLRSFTRPTGMLDRALFEKIIGEVHRHVTYLTFYFQGEPYLHPQFTEMIELSVRKGIYTATSTNAHFLDDEQARKTVQSGLHRLIISVDGATQETYNQYCIGGSLDKVLEGARKVVEWKKKLRSSTPHIIFQFLVVRHNEHELEDIRRIAADTGADEVVFKTAQVYDYENGNPLIPANPKYSRYVKTEKGTWKVKNRLDNHCWKMWQSCVITWDGKVVPCCFDKDALHVMGDLRTESLRTIWNNSRYREFRARLFKNRSEIDICTNCSEGTTVFSE